MIGLLLIPFAVWITMIIICIRENEGIIFIPFISAIISLLLSMILIMFLSTLASTDGAEIVYAEDKVNIVALEDNNTIEQKGFLARGYINEKLQYAYIYETPKGLTVKSVDAEHSYINYTEGKPILIIKTATRFKDSILNLIAIPLDSTEYYFYIPEGSVITTYNIDLQ